MIFLVIPAELPCLDLELVTTSLSAKHQVLHTLMLLLATLQLTKLEGKLITHTTIQQLDNDTATTWPWAAKCKKSCARGTLSPLPGNI